MDLNFENKSDNLGELKNMVIDGLNIHTQILTKYFEILSSDLDNIKYTHFV
jgi:hypothetical protein